MLSVFLGLLRLSYWQYERYSSKQQKLDAIQLVSADRPIVLRPQADLSQYDIAWVKVTGQYVGQPIVWMNRFRRHQLGVEILWPFQIQGSSSLVFVNHGWLEQMPEYFTLPYEGRPVSVIAQVTHPKTGFLLGQNLESYQGYLSMQTFSSEDLSDRVHMPVANEVLQLNEDNASPYDRHWPLFSLNPRRHLAYAGQWALFALVWGVGCAMLIRRRGL